MGNRNTKTGMGPTRTPREEKGEEEEEEEENTSRQSANIQRKLEQNVPMKACLHESQRRSWLHRAAWGGCLWNKSILCNTREARM